MPGEALELLRLLLLSRAAESRLKVLADEGLVRQAPRREPFREAGPVGTALGLRRAQDGSGDLFAPTFRPAGALELFGVTLDDFFRDHLAARVGPARDAGAELHRVDWSAGLLAPVVPLGLLAQVVGGWALGVRMRGEDRVGVVCDTDGATSTGAWHEGLVFAAARRVPMVAVVDADAHPEQARKHSRVTSYVDKATGYGLGSECVDGGDVEAVVAAVRGAVERARGGHGVQMVEVRYGDTDPVETLRDRILGEGVVTEDELSRLEADAVEACQESVARVRTEASPERPQSLSGVYAGSEPTLRRTWADPAARKVV